MADPLHSKRPEPGPPAGPRGGRPPGGWVQLGLACDAGVADRLSDLLGEAGAVAVTLQAEAPGSGDDAGAVYEPAPGESPAWSRTRVIGLFEPDSDTGPVLSFLQGVLGPGVFEPRHAGWLEDRAWAREWQRFAAPLSFGHRLWVCPTGFPPPAGAAAADTCIQLDPGLAFGTGSHPSTAQCLEWLAADPPRDAEVIDYGCGSGILALAALRLGARRAWAVDHDPQALQAARENARRNGLSGAVHAVTPAGLPRLQADVLVANILADPLIELAPRFAGLLRTGGRVALAGILAPQASAVRRACGDGFRLDREERNGDWVMLAGRRTAHP